MRFLKLLIDSSRDEWFTWGYQGNGIERDPKFIREQMDKINIPNPEILEPVKTQLKGIGDLISCLFKQILVILVLLSRI